MDRALLAQLNSFFAEAAKATYASGGEEVKTWRKGFHDFEYGNGDWYYRDSYAGWFRSWGQEIIWYRDEPFWTSLYGGGMTEEHQGDKELAHSTFEFLKKALGSDGKADNFQPRGPEKYTDGDWAYACKVNGDITKFDGAESVSFKGNVVFTHNFNGGLVVN